MKRIVVINWKEKADKPLQAFSNLKLLCETYPQYNYNTLNNYLSKNKIAYENEDVRIERLTVNTEVIPKRKIAMVVNRVPMRIHNDEAADREYWLSRPPVERLRAVTQLSMQFLAKGQRMDKTHIVKRKFST